MFGFRLVDETSNMSVDSRDDAFSIYIVHTVNNVSNTVSQIPCTNIQKQILDSYNVQPEDWFTNANLKFNCLDINQFKNSKIVF